MLKFTHASCSYRLRRHILNSLKSTTILACFLPFFPTLTRRVDNGHFFFIVVCYVSFLSLVLVGIIFFSLLYLAGSRGWSSCKRTQCHRKKSTWIPRIRKLSKTLPALPVLFFYQRRVLVVDSNTELSSGYLKNKNLAIATATKRSVLTLGRGIVFQLYILFWSGRFYQTRVICLNHKPIAPQQLQQYIAKRGSLFPHLPLHSPFSPSHSSIFIITIHIFRHVDFVSQIFFPSHLL